MLVLIRLWLYLSILFCLLRIGQFGTAGGSGHDLLLGCGVTRGLRDYIGRFNTLGNQAILVDHGPVLFPSSPPRRHQLRLLVRLALRTTQLALNGKETPLVIGGSGTEIERGHAA